MSYEILKIPWTLEEPYSEMSKEGAKEFFEWLNQNVDYRLGQLDLLVKLSGESFILDFSPESLLPLGHLLKRILRIRKKTDAEMKVLVDSVPDWLKETVKSQDIVLSEQSLSIAFDLAIYFSYVLMKADKRIKWKMYTKASKLNINRNQLILTGTTKLECNPIMSVKLICFQIATGKEKPDALINFYNGSMKELLGLSKVEVV